MKKKETKSKVKDVNDDEFNLDDLEGLDGDFNFEEVTDDRNPQTTTGVAKELATEAGKGFLDSLVKKTAEKALPEEYASNYHTALEYGDFARETFVTNKNKINNSLYLLGKEVKKIIPFQLGILNKFIEKYEAEFSQFKAESEEQIREASIQSNIASIFDKQLEIQKTFEANRLAREEVQEKKNLVVDKHNISLFTSIDKNIAEHSAFTLQISKEYYKKSLELQYKTYFIQADMLKSIRDYYAGFSVQFDHIVKNTALPEFVKLNNSERVTDILRTQFIENTYKQVFSQSEYVQGIKKNISNLVTEKVSNITDKIGNVTELLSGINMADEAGASKGSVMRGVLSGMAGSTLGEKVSDYISPKIKEKIKDNRIINTGGNMLELLATSPTTFFKVLREGSEAKAEEYSDRSSPVRALASMFFGGASELLGTTNIRQQDYDIKNPSILTHASPAIFDNKTHRSITEIIPLYLSKILAENTNLRLMYKTVNSAKLSKLNAKGTPIFSEQKEQVYSYEDRRLMSVEDFRESVQKSVFKHINRTPEKIKQVTASITNVAEHEAKRQGMDEKTIANLSSKKSQAVLDKYITEASTTLPGKKFTYENLVDNYDTDEQLKLIVERNPGLKEHLDTLKKLNLGKQAPGLEDRLKDIQNIYPVAPIKELFKVVSQLAEAETLNTISDEEANIISKLFLVYILKDKTDIVPDNIVSGQCFKYITEKDYSIVKSSIDIFTAEVKVIQMSDDIAKKSALITKLGHTNNALKQLVTANPTVFQILANYSNELQDTGKLTAGNLVEGKLGSFKENESVNLATVKRLSKIKPKDTVLARKEKAKLAVIDTIEKSKFGQHLTGYANITKTFMDEVKSADSYKDVTQSVTKFLKGTIAQSKSGAKDLYDSATKEFTKLSDVVQKELDKATEKNLPVLKEKIVKGLDGYSVKIDALIAKEKDIKKVEIENFNNLIKSLGESVQTTNELDRLQKKLDRLVKRKDIEIKILETLKSKMSIRRNEINNINTDNLKVTEFIQSLKKTYNSLLTEAKETMKQYEAESKAEAEIL